LCFSYYVVGTVPIELVMNLFLKKNRCNWFLHLFCFVFFFTFQLDANGWNIISSSVRISFEPEQNDSRTVTFELPG
jgi:hypothetical protein